MILLWLAQIALAGQVYINGTLVNPGQLAGTKLEKVEVTFDAAGNVRVNAPGYQIEVVEPAAAPAAPATAYPQPSSPPAAALTTPAATAPAAPGVHPSGVPKATWWLVVEDNGSIGHTVEVVVNGQLAQTVRSGEPVRILDVGGYLQPGSNAVTVRSDSVAAGGGTMYVYVGKGTDRSGTVVMDAPDVQFGLGASRNGPYERAYTVQVD